LRLLARLLRAAREAGRTGREIELLALRSLALQAQGHAAEALTALAEALSLAEPEGYIRVFVDEGEPMARLLRRLENKEVLQGQPRLKVYSGKLLAAFPDLDSASAGQSPTIVPQPQLVETLSEREL